MGSRKGGIGLAWLAAVWMAAAAPSAAAAEPVVLQLRWDHQFQFAGYYAAQWQGFYADEGIEVEIRSAIRPDRSSRNPITEVSEGRADFGIGGADILVAMDRHTPLVITASIFQQSPTGIMVRREVGATSPADLVRLRTRFGAGDLTEVEMKAMLHAEGIDSKGIATLLPSTGNWGDVYADMKSGAIDAYAGYLLSGLWWAKREGVPVTVLRPSSYGIDFYGDSLFTTRDRADRDPDLVERFTRASLAGWRYALEHRAAVARRIAETLERQYAEPDPLAFNLFQADLVARLTLFPTVEPGHINPERWQHMHEHLGRAGMVSGRFDGQQAIFDATRRRERRRETLIAGMAAGSALLILGVLLVLLWNRTLRRRVREKTAALTESEELFRAAFDNAAVGIALTDPSTGRFVRVNDRYGEITGYPPAELAGLSFKDITHPDDLKRDVNGARRLVDGDLSRFIDEKRYLRKDGGVVWVNLSVGQVRGADGATRFFVPVIEDITERKGADARLQRTVDELLRSNSELERFAYVASHDLKEPLRSIISFSQILSRRYHGQLDDQADEYIDFIVSGAKRLYALIDGLLDYSRLAAKGAPFASVDAAVAIRLALDNLAETLSESGGQVVVGAMPTVAGDLIQLIELFQNLIGNGLKFRRDGIAPVIEVSAERRDGLWEFAVHDNGIGIDPIHHDRIFLIFQRLHGQGTYPGTGLGLSICKRIVERHGGTIRVDPDGQQGATFKFTLPAVEVARPPLTGVAGTDDPGSADDRRGESAP